MTDERHSRPLARTLVTDPAAKAQRESENGLRQFDLMLDLIRRHTAPAAPRFRLRPSTLLDLNRAAVDGIEATAGTWRPGSMVIEGSRHKPPPAAQVPELIEDLCDYVNDSWSTASAAHLAAYVMWRINWIHPFDDGNGRTARAASYMVLSIRTGYVLPGERALIEQIASFKNPYYFALEAADKAHADGRIDVAALEKIVSEGLAQQLVDVHRKATGAT